MATAKKASKADALLKIMAWGEPGAGKTRMALSFPGVLMIDLERGSRLYADQFDFYVAEPTPELDAPKLVNRVLDEIEGNEYPDVHTLVIDPITDYLDALEAALLAQEAKNGVNLAALRGPQKAQVHARIKDGIRARLNRLLGLPVNIVFLARAKNEWSDKSGQMSVIGRKADSNEIVDYLSDVVLHVQKGGQAKVIKSRLADLPEIIPSASYADLLKALTAQPVTPKPVDRLTASKVVA